MGKWLQRLEKQIGNGPSGPKRVQTVRWMLIIGLAGVCLMILNSFLEVKPVETGDPAQAPASPSQDAFVTGGEEQSPFEEYEEAYARSLKDILENVAGVGAVDILVTVESTEEIVPHQDLHHAETITDEQDTGGARRHITEVTRDGKIVLMEVSGKEQPIILKTLKPKISGVAIVAEGAENLTVQKMIKDIVSKGLDVPPHRITVVPRKQR